MVRDYVFKYIKKILCIIYGQAMASTLHKKKKP